mgnify:CR=1 FL=1
MKFGDNIVAYILVKIKEYRQKCVRKAIADKWQNDVDPRIHWVKGTVKENEGLSTNPQEWAAQKLYLSNLGHFAAERMHNWRIWALLPLLLLLLITEGFSILWGVQHQGDIEPFLFVFWLSLGFLFYISTFVMGSFGWRKFLPKRLVVPEEVEAVERLMERTFLRTFPKETPEDLQDRFRVLAVDRDGDATAGQLLAADLEFSSVDEQIDELRELTMFAGYAMWAIIAIMSPTTSIIMFAILFIGVVRVEGLPIPQGLQDILSLNFWRRLFVIVGIVGAYFPAMMGSTSITYQPWLITAVMIYTLLMVMTGRPSPLRQRAQMLEDAVKDAGTEHLIEAAGRQYFINLEAARIKQIEAAIEDKSPLIKFGRTTGLLSQRRDPLAPSELGLSFALSVQDLSAHLGVLGATGTGKTSGVIRPLVRQWLEYDQGGLLILDGKGTLPLELANQQGYQLISPEHQGFNPVEQLNPDAVAETMQALYGDDSGERYWVDAGIQMIRHAAILLEASKKEYTLPNIERVILNQGYRQDVLAEAITDESAERQLASANYFIVELAAMPEKTRESIVNTVRVWLSNLTGHEKLGKWVGQSKGAQIEDCLTGKRIGLLLPEALYGRGGQLISMFALRRLYDAIKKRGDQWQKQEGQKRVFLVADEVQNLVSNNDLAMLPIARSLGLSVCYSTQNVDGLYKKLKKEGALQLLGNLNNIISLPAKTKDSNDYLSERVGEVWKAGIERVNGIPDSAADLGRYMYSGTDKHTRATRQGKAAPRLSWAIGVWRAINTVNKDRSRLKNMTMRDEKTGNFNYSAPQLSIKSHRLITPDEINTLLAEPNTAIAVGQRGRVVRRDVIKLQPEY